MVREAIAQAVAESADVRVLDAVIRVASNPDEYGMVRTFAIQALRAFDDNRAFTALVDVLRDDEDAGARRLAANTLGQTCKQAAVAPLIRALGDRDSRVRTGAVKALGDIGDSEATEHVMRVLISRAEESAVRMMAGLALGDLGDDSARENLRRVCTDTNEPTPVRGGAAIGWSRLRDEEALAPLLEMLTDPDHALRRFAATALGWLGDARAVGPLIEALQGDGQSEVRKQAVVALDKIGDPGAVEALLDAIYDDHPTVRWYAVRALPQFNDARAIEPLIDALRQGNEDISAAAIAALAEVGDESAISTLEWAGENYVASYPEEYSFGEAAAEAIARIRERLRAVDRAQG